MAGTCVDIGEFVTVERIPVLETGISYPASTGPFTCTLEMLEEAVVYANDDPHGSPPRIKIGHSENPINDDLQSLFDELNEGRDESKPSLGTILNLMVEDESVLVGDFHGVPAWLAAILETAYPARSIEGGSWRNEANGKDYAFMLEAVSLLGVVGPGCTSLADLQELFSEDGPQVSVVEMSRAKPKGGGPMPVVAQVNVEDIRRAFYDDWAQGDKYWFWDRELLIDPLEMIVQDPDENQLWRLPISLKDGEGTESVEFGEPEAIKIKYVPDPGAEKEDSTKAVSLVSTLMAKEGLENVGKVLAVNTKPPRLKERRGKESPIMGLDIPALRARLKVDEGVLPDDATEEQVNELLSSEEPDTPDEEVEESEDEEGNDDESDEGNDDDDDDEPDVTARGVMIDKDALAELQRDGADGRAARKQQLKADRKQYLDSAVKKGKFPPAARNAYATQLAKGGEVEKSTREFIDKLPDNTVPVDEVGEVSSDEQLTASAYDPDWLSPAERRRIKAASEGETPGPITKERV